jgi:hypothetical protein
MHVHTRRNSFRIIQLSSACVVRISCCKASVCSNVSIAHLFKHASAYFGAAAEPRASSMPASPILIAISLALQPCESSKLAVAPCFTSQTVALTWRNKTLKCSGVSCLQFRSRLADSSMTRPCCFFNFALYLDEYMGSFSHSCSSTSAPRSRSMVETSTRALSAARCIAPDCLIWAPCYRSNSTTSNDACPHASWR